jgi:hypothetical protein
MSYYRICLDANASSLSVLDKPGPTASLDTSQSGIELLLERVQAAITVIDGLGQGASWGFTTTLLRRSQILPEQSVVEVATCAI